MISRMPRIPRNRITTIAAVVLAALIVAGTD